MKKVNVRYTFPDDRQATLIKDVELPESAVFLGASVERAQRAERPARNVIVAYTNDKGNPVENPFRNPDLQLMGDQVVVKRTSGTITLGRIVSAHTSDWDEPSRPKRSVYALPKGVR